MYDHVEETRDGMRIEWDAPIEMDDGLTLRADVFRPPDDGEYPVIISHGPYGKLLHIFDWLEDKWRHHLEKYPDIASDTSQRYLNWEVVDPEKWVPEDYAVVRVDSRGAGRSPGYLDPCSERETRDFAACIEWAGRQPWSNGKVGINGISYYAWNAWQVAALQPDHLAAICPWEGAADFYRDVGHHGGISSTFHLPWIEEQIYDVQHGVGANGYKSRMTGDWVAGPRTLTKEELGANRSDVVERWSETKLATDEFWTSRTPDLSKVEVPVLSAANWGGHGLHTRGNFEGFKHVGTDQTWLEVHGDDHTALFYTDYGVGLQQQFFDRFLKGEANGWEDRPRVQMAVRRPHQTFREFERRHEADWPLPRTEWERHYLHPSDRSLSGEAPADAASVTYEALGDGVTFLSDPLEGELELTGPSSAKLFVSSDTADADLFVIVRLFDENMEEVVFQGSNDPHTPIALGWLRASHRKLDEERSTPEQPYHPHDEVEPLEPGAVYELDVEVLPTNIVAPPGSRLAVTVRGKDYQYAGDVEHDPRTEERWNEGPWRGVGPFKHIDPDDRPPETFGGEVTLHAGPDRPLSVLLPTVE